MKQLNIFIIIFLTFFSNLYAYDLSNIEDMNVSHQEQNTIKIPIPKKRKKSKSLYDKFEDAFSDYDGAWVEDMFTYSVDIFMPDELILATKDIIDNRDDKGFSSKTKHLPKEMANDAYSIMLTTAYYHFQDISRITSDLWEDEACEPDSFEYNTSIEPKEPLLNLEANDKNARGVTKNGVVLPINLNFLTALYPYASRPDGCSAEKLQDLYDDANKFFDDDQWLREACNEHDRCYFTEGTTAKECNAKFIVEAVDSCNNISGRDTLLFMGSRDAVCGIKALIVSAAANACAEKYFAEAQRKQKAYNQWVIRYEEAFKNAQQKKKIKYLNNDYNK